MKVAFYLIFLVTMSGCGNSEVSMETGPVDPRAALVGGVELEPEHHELWGSVKIMRVLGNGRGDLCTGNYLTPTWVLTAGHCVAPHSGVTPNAPIQVTMGLQSTTARRFIHHPEYDYDGCVNRTSDITCRHDVVLLELAQPLEIVNGFTNDHYPGFRRGLWRHGGKQLVGHFLPIGGYGLNSRNSGSGVLRWHTLRPAAFVRGNWLFHQPDNNAIANHGDSGAAYMTASNSDGMAVRTPIMERRIGAIVSFGASVTGLKKPMLFFDTEPAVEGVLESYAVPAEEFSGWVESVVGPLP